MSDTPSYRLRNADIENLDLSEFSKDYSAEELAAVRQALFQKQREQQEKFNALPIVDQAKIYAGEKFGDLKKTIEDNPELLGYGVAALAAKGAYDTAKPMVTGAVDTAKGIYGRMIGQPKPEIPVEVSTTDTFSPEKVPTAEQATQEQVKQGKIKTGKAGGSITPQESQILGNIESGKVKGKVSDVVKGAVAPDLTKEQQGMKKYLVSYYGGGPEGEKAYEKVGEILGYRPAFEPGKGGGLKPSENELIKAYRKENIAGPKINLTHDMKKAIKGGSLAALAAIPGFADAAQNKDYGKMADIASDFAVLPFAQSREAGAPTIPDSRFAEAAKLGSPYYNTEWSKKERSKAVPPPPR